MASWLSRYNPTPGFPPYSGPYAVGSVDVEVATSELQAPSPAPDPDIATVSFRIFYPCEASSGKHRPVRWVQQPQRQTISAYARFLGAGSAFSEIFAFFPQLFYYVTIPVQRNARLLAPPTKHKRWPVMIFSHGLGGSRNAYSHLCGSLSSHGVVVIAPDHRDGSAPISYIRATDLTKARVVDYRRLSHAPSQEVHEGRDEQLRMRLWELGLTHEALLNIDKGKTLRNLDPNSENHHKHDKVEVLNMFQGQLDVHQPGRISWAGHSFGAATVVQFLKSTFWSSATGQTASVLPGYTPLFDPSPSSAILQQITPASTLTLLDLWCLPLRSHASRWLWEKPLPCYASDGPGGTNLLAILSEAFFKWRGNLKDVKRALSENPSSDSKAHSKPGPRFFYPFASAHLSQSDFGILFPWLTKKVFKAEEPERTLKLNVRAILEMLRQNGFEVADTSHIDMEEELTGQSADMSVHGADEAHDWKILDPSGNIRGWIAVTTDQDDLVSSGKAETVLEDRKKSPSDAVVEGEVLGEMRDQKL